LEAGLYNPDGICVMVCPASSWQHGRSWTVEPPGIGPLHLWATRRNKLEIRSDTPDPMSTSTCNWWTACADDAFNSQQGRCEMQTMQGLVPTNVNMYRVARKRRKPKNN
jgi:hypothetical protein